MDHGYIVQDGEVKKVVAQYIDNVNLNLDARRVGVYQNLGHQRGTGEIQFTDVRILNMRGERTREFTLGRIVRMNADFHAYSHVDRLVGVFYLVDGLNHQNMVTKWTGELNGNAVNEGDQGMVSFRLNAELLSARKYYVKLLMNDGVRILPFDVWDGVGTEFFVKYPLVMDYSNWEMFDDIPLTTLPRTAEIRNH